MVQQLCHGTKAKWLSTPIQRDTNTTNTQRPINEWYISKPYECTIHDPIRFKLSLPHIYTWEKPSYLTTFACQLGRYRLSFRAAPAGDMFQQKIEEIFKDLPNIFSIADDIWLRVMMLMAETMTEHHSSVGMLSRELKT